MSKQVHVTTSDKSRLFHSTRRCVYQIHRENMLYLIKFFCISALRETRDRIRMCTAHKHTKLKGSKSFLTGSSFFSFFFFPFSFFSNTKLRLYAILSEFCQKYSIYNYYYILIIQLCFEIIRNHNFLVIIHFKLFCKI